MGWFDLMAVDGTGLLVRCSRAAARTGLSAPDGTPTGALTLFAGSLAALVREIQPQYLLVAWDGEASRAWRREICPEYKASRPAFPEKRPIEAVQAREFCDAAGITQWQMDDFEADDLLAAASRLAYQDLPETGVLLCSDDKDILQLAEGGRVWVRTLGKDGSLNDADTVELLYGVRPEHLPMLRALAGDPSDGIPGVPGIGPARALQMLRSVSLTWPLLVQLLPDPVTRDHAAAWLKVMTLHSPPEVPEDHDEAGVLNIRKTEWNPGNVLPVLEKYGMNRMVERVSKGTFW
jgi:DNA polymerase I